MQVRVLGRCAVVCLGIETERVQPRKGVDADGYVQFLAARHVSMAPVVQHQLPQAAA